MIRLASILYSMIGTTLAGSAVVVVLTMGHVTWIPILGAAVAGAVLALPVSWVVAQKLSNLS